MSAKAERISELRIEVFRGRFENTGVLITVDFVLLPEAAMRSLGITQERSGEVSKKRGPNWRTQQQNFLVNYLNMSLSNCYSFISLAKNLGLA